MIELAKGGCRLDSCVAVVRNGRADSDRVRPARMVGYTRAHGASGNGAAVRAVCFIGFFIA